MRKVVERITCDLGGEATYSDTLVNGHKTHEEFNFSWGGKSYKMDVCDRCKPHLTDLPISTLISKAHIDVSPPSKKTPKPKATKTPAHPHSGMLPGPSACARGDKQECPSCEKQFGTRRGLQKHWTQRQNEEAEGFPPAMRKAG